MATGYVVSGRGDLDVLFKARTSAAIANTGFKSNGGVDLAQRFEPRGAVAPIADTGFKKAGTDLSQLFMAFGAVGGTLIADLSLTVAANGSQKGFQRSTSAFADFGFVSSQAVDGSTYLLEGICTRQNGTGQLFELSVSGSTQAPDADTTWQRVEVTGTFASGAALRTLVRSTNNLISNFNEGGRAYRRWDFNAQPFDFVTGNVYGVKVYKL